MPPTSSAMSWPRPSHNQARSDRSGAARLQVRDVSTEAERGACPLRNVSLDLWPGEVLGIAGVDGNGQKHLAEVLAGQRRAGSGTIAIAGADVTADGVPERRRHGVRYVTDERLGEGTVGAFSVATNLVLQQTAATTVFLGVPRLSTRPPLLSLVVWLRCTSCTHVIGL